MARIKGIDLPKNKRGVIGLTYIYGIGSSFAASILDQAKVSHDIKVMDWTDEQANKIRSIINDNYTVEGELRATSVHSTFCGEQGCVFWTVRRQLACPSLLR